MSRVVKIALVVAVAVGSFLIGSLFHRSGSETAAATAGALKYICPMHPDYVSDRPGIAPCCGMQLVAVTAEAAAEALAAKTMPPGSVRIPAEKQQLAGIRSVRVERDAGEHTIRTVGRVAPDDTRVYRLTAASDGWLRDVLPPTAGSFVRKDEVLGVCYNREALTAQQAYFYALAALDRQSADDPQNRAGQIEAARAQVDQSRENLEALGMPAIQVAEIAKLRKPTYSIQIRTPIAGFILERNVNSGQRVERGELLYRIADLSRVWVLADVFEADAPRVHAGAPAIVHVHGRDIRARTSNILPQFDPGARTMKVRIEMDNPGYELRPGMFLDVEFPVKLGPGVTVPAAAVVNTGTRKLVYVDRGGGWFEPREVRTAWRAGDRIAVTKGLREGERVVAEGNFLIDSESRMKLAAPGAERSRAVALAKDPVCGMDVDPAAAPRIVQGGTAHYFCSERCRREYAARAGVTL